MLCLPSRVASGIDCSTACVLHISAQILLYDAHRSNVARPFLVSRKRGHASILGFAGTFRLDGTAASAVIQALPIHTWFESCLLGSKFLGFGDSFRSYFVEMYV